jgi:hypothetical protein
LKAEYPGILQRDDRGVMITVRCGHTGNRIVDIPAGH